MFSLILALGLGSLAGYYNGWPDQIVTRAGEILLALPWFYFVVALRAALPLNLSAPATLLMLFTLLGLLGWALPARLFRAMVRSLRAREFVLATRSQGARDARIFLVPRAAFPAASGPDAVSRQPARLHHYRSQSLVPRSGGCGADPYLGEHAHTASAVRGADFVSLDVGAHGGDCSGIPFIEYTGKRACLGLCASAVIDTIDVLCGVPKYLSLKGGWSRRWRRRRHNHASILPFFKNADADDSPKGCKDERENQHEEESDEHRHNRESAPSQG